VANDNEMAAAMRAGSGYPAGIQVPVIPPLPEKVTTRFPELKAWEISMKRWRDELTYVLRNGR